MCRWSHSSGMTAFPTDIANATVLSTGTYSARLTYRILYKTNYSASYQVLASNLLTSNNYSFALNAIPDAGR